MKAKVNRANITRHLIEYQLDMVGKRLVDTLDDDMWYFNWTMTQEQHEEFKRYAIPLLKKYLNLTKGGLNQHLVGLTYSLAFALKIKNYGSTYDYCSGSCTRTTSSIKFYTNESFKQGIS